MSAFTFRGSGGRQLRRPAVNVVGSSSSDQEDYDRSKKYCKYDGRLLAFMQNIQNYRCVECGWIWVDEEKLKKLKEQEAQEQQQPQPSQAVAPEPLGTIRGTKNRAGQRGSTINTEAEDAALKIRPVPGAIRRSEQLAQQRELNQYKGNDADLQLIKNRGYTIIDTDEHVSSEGTYNSSEGYR
jgi:hypothetical protein